MILIFYKYKKTSLLKNKLVFYYIILLFYMSLVTTTSTPVSNIFFITISPFFTGDFNSISFKEFHTFKV